MLGLLGLLGRNPIPEEIVGSTALVDKENTHLKLGLLGGRSRAAAGRVSLVSLVVCKAEADQAD